MYDEVHTLRETIEKEKSRAGQQTQKNLGQDNSGYPETDEPQSVQQTEGTEVES